MYVCMQPCNIQVIPWKNIKSDIIYVTYLEIMDERSWNPCIFLFWVWDLSGKKILVKIYETYTIWY